MQIDGTQHEISAHIQVWTDCVKIVLMGPEKGAGAFELDIPHGEILNAAKKIQEIRKKTKRE
jgi:hypothetical protein